jgi:hypothetical protein
MDVTRMGAVSLFLAGLGLTGCSRSPLSDLPLWRVELDGNGHEVRLVHLPFEQTAYDLDTHRPLRTVLDRNQDGISDRIVTYEGLGHARREETDTDFDGIVDRWDSFGSDGQRLRSASARDRTGRPDRTATYGSDGQLVRVETDSNRDGRSELVQVFESRRLVESRIDADGNGKVERVQEFRGGFLSSEAFDTDEDGLTNLRMTYDRKGSLLNVEVLQTSSEGRRR